MKCCENQGYEVVCPDGRIRHMPYHNEGDARCDAGVNTERGHRYSPGNPPEWYDPPCPRREARGTAHSRVQLIVKPR